jgi:hypothetical protein
MKAQQFFSFDPVDHECIKEFAVGAIVGADVPTYHQESKKSRKITQQVNINVIASWYETDDELQVQIAARIDDPFVAATLVAASRDKLVALILPQTGVLSLLRLIDTTTHHNSYHFNAPVTTPTRYGACVVFVTQARDGSCVCVGTKSNLRGLQLALYCKFATSSVKLAPVRQDANINVHTPRPLEVLMHIAANIEDDLLGVLSMAMLRTIGVELNSGCQPSKDWTNNIWKLKEVYTKCDLRYCLKLHEQWSVLQHARQRAQKQARQRKRKRCDDDTTLTELKLCTPLAWLCFGSLLETTCVVTHVNVIGCKMWEQLEQKLIAGGTSACLYIHSIMDSLRFKSISFDSELRVARVEKCTQGFVDALFQCSRSDMLGVDACKWFLLNVSPNVYPFTDMKIVDNDLIVRNMFHKDTSLRSESKCKQIPACRVQENHPQKRMKTADDAAHTILTILSNNYTERYVNMPHALHGIAVENKARETVTFISMWNVVYKVK